MDLSAALDAFGVDEVLVEVLAQVEDRALLHDSDTSRYLGLTRPGGGPIAVYVHRTRLLVTLPQHRAQHWARQLGTVHDSEADVTHLVVKREDVASPATRALAVAAITDALTH